MWAQMPQQQHQAATVQSNFVPTIWSARFLSRLDDMLVWGSRANRNYEGEIQAGGDTVKIPTPTTTVTVRDYTIDTDIAAAETTAGTTQDLSIDQQKYFHFYVDDIDRAQARPNIMDDAMGRAARGMALAVDGHLQSRFQTDGYAAARRIAQVAGDPQGASDAWGKAFIRAMIKAKVTMSNADIPMDGRWAVVFPEVIAGLENYFLVENPSGVWLPATQEQSLRNGFAGRLLGFDLHVTRRVTAGANISTKATKRCTLGQGNEAVTFANQITENEAYRPERRFGEAVKGLMVYGSKTALADRLWTIEAQIAA